MPVDYALGKIYKLYIGDLVYIGSTAQPRLSMRLGQHKAKYKQWVKTGKIYMSSFELFKVGMPRIELIDLFPCGSKDELRAREGFYQRATNCVNKNIAGRSQAEWCEDNRPHILEQRKQYRGANKENIHNYNKQYYVANQEKLSEQKKQWYVENQDKVIKQVKQYRDANKEKINEQKKQYRCANKQKISEYYRVYYANNKRIERLTLFIQKHIQKRLNNLGAKTENSLTSGTCDF